MMGHVTLLSYATDRWVNSQRLLGETGRQHGADIIRSCGPGDLPADFLQRNAHILAQKRGAGYWLWKPYLILNELRGSAADDFVVYSDSGIAIIADLAPLLAHCRDEGGILLFAVHGQPNFKWTKRDCFALLGCDERKFWECDQYLGSFSVFQRSERALEFVESWLAAAQDERLITDRPNTCGLPNLDGFVDHRHDQSILSLLAAKRGIAAFRDPTQWGNSFKLPGYRVSGESTPDGYGSPFTNSLYGTLLHHHRGALALPPHPAA
jgi:hypothetical protein